MAPTDVRAPAQPAAASDPSASWPQTSDARANNWSGMWRSVEGFFYPTVTLVVLLVLWEVGAVALHVPNYLLPQPSAVVRTAFNQFPYLWSNAGPTVQEIALGFGLSVVVGIPIAVAIVSSRITERCVYPLLVASQTVPKVALAPLLVVWFGFGPLPKVLIAFLIAFFPIVIDTAVGLRGVPPDMIDLAHSMGASRLSLFWKIRVMHALPNIFGGLKVAMTLAVIGANVGEFVGTDRGLGYVLQTANGRLDTSMLFAAIFFLVIIGIVSFMLVDVVERIAIPWHVSMRKEPRGPADT